MPKLTSVLLQQDEWTIIRDLGIDGVARNEAATFGMDADDLFDAFEEEAIEQPVLSVVAKRTRDDASAGTAKRQKEDSGSAVAADAGNAAAVPTAALKSEKDTATSNLDYSLPDTTPSQAFGTSAAASTAAGDDGGQHETIKTVLSRGDVDESKTTAADFDVEKTAAPAKVRLLRITVACTSLLDLDLPVHPRSVPTTCNWLFGAQRKRPCVSPYIGW